MLSSNRQASKTNLSNSTHPPALSSEQGSDRDSGEHYQGGDNTIKKPPIPEKPSIGMIASNKRKPPVKKKPLVKSQSVDLTQVGGSEWKDFCERRRQEVEVSDPEETGRFATVKGLAEHRNNSMVDQTISEDLVLHLQQHREESVEMPTTRSRTNSDRSETDHGSETDILNLARSGGSFDLEKCQLTNGNSANEHNSIINDSSITNNSNSSSNNDRDHYIGKNNNSGNNKDKNNNRNNSNGNNNSNNGQTVCSSEPKSEPSTPPSCTTEPTCNDNKQISQTSSMEEVATPPSATITLPKPRQISSELKRSAFSRNRAMSMPVVGLGGLGGTLPQANLNQIKKSSDFLKDRVAPTEKVPYFLRQSKGSNDIQEEPDISSLSISNGNTEAEDVFFS